MTHDYCIIGGGIVGLATAMALLEQRPGASLLLLDKEDQLGRHQTGHNSGVIHAGIYYAPGSLKAELCKRGAQATKNFCHEHGIAFEVCGKLLVASNDLEMQRMQALYQRSQQNGLRTASRSSDWTRTPCAIASRTSSARARCSSMPPASSTTRKCARPWPG